MTRSKLDAAHELLKTDHYTQFEQALREAFANQLKTANYDVKFEFRSIDETNLYRGLYPTLVEGESPRNPTEVGSGVRNLLVLALFQAFAQTFRGNAVLGIEEPELYLHPHAQRSLMRQFDEMAVAGNQIFISSHSPFFLDITRSDRIVLVDRKIDNEDEVCTQVRTSTPDELLALRKALHPDRRITQDSLRAFLRNVQSPAMSEAFFAKLCILVEGPSEGEAFPIYARHIGFPLDEMGISIVSAGGKTALDTLQHIYRAHTIPTYVMFDNDEGLKSDDKSYNKVLCRLLGLTETDTPARSIAGDFAILGGDWEQETERAIEGSHPGLYLELVAEARSTLGLQPGRNKPLIARYVAQALVARGLVPDFVVQIVEKLRKKIDGKSAAPSGSDEAAEDPFF